MSSRSVTRVSPRPATSCSHCRLLARANGTRYFIAACGGIVPARMRACALDVSASISASRERVVGRGHGGLELRVVLAVRAAETRDCDVPLIRRLHPLRAHAEPGEVCVAEFLRLD